MHVLLLLALVRAPLDCTGSDFQTFSGKHKSPKAHYQCMKGEKTDFLYSFCAFSGSSYIFQWVEIQKMMRDQMSYKDKTSGTNSHVWILWKCTIFV